MWEAFQNLETRPSGESVGTLLNSALAEGRKRHDLQSLRLTLGCGWDVLGEGGNLGCFPVLRFWQRIWVAEGPKTSHLISPFKPSKRTREPPSGPVGRFVKRERRGI